LPNGAGHVPAGKPEPPELVAWDEFLDQRKELSLLKPDVCVKQLPRRMQRLSIDDAGRHGDVECAGEPLELHVLDACLAEGSRLRPDVPEEKREELFFLIPKVDTLVVPEELHEFPGRREPSRSIWVRGSTTQPHCLHEPIVMVARKRDQGGVTLHSTTLGYGVIPAVLAELHSIVHTTASSPTTVSFEQPNVGRPIGRRQLADRGVNGIRADAARRDSRPADVAFCWNCDSDLAPAARAHRPTTPSGIPVLSSALVPRDEFTVVVAALPATFHAGLHERW
jgi:hypothetical protein